ncbi:MAG: tetratricopeptide repeat protein [Rhodospirillales bacterium]|nr:MAG: tetratricopeptide repeat protein [Rhodospirillales bacterium]
MQVTSQASTGRPSSDGSQPLARWHDVMGRARQSSAAGDLATARDCCKDALEIAEAHGPGTEWLAESYIRLADLSAAFDQPDIALRLYRQAVAILEALPEGASTALAHAVSNMGRLHMLNGEMARAIELTTAGDALQRKLNMPVSPSIKLNLALVVATIGREQAAEQAFEATLAAADRCRGSIGGLAFAANDNFALFAIVRGRKADAEMALRRCLILRQEAAGPRHRDYAEGLLNLARLHLRGEAEEEAETLLLQAADVLSHSGSATTGPYIEALYLLAWQAVHRKDAAAAEKFSEQLRSLARARSRSARAAEAAALYLAALTNRDSGNRAALETAMRRALTLADRLRGDFRRLGDDLSGALLRDLAELLAETGREAEAERLEVRADELRSQRRWLVTGFVFATA